MPNHVKLAISVVVSLAAIAGYVFQDNLGQAGPKYAVLFLGVLMVGALWLFPEVKKDAPAVKQDRPGAPQ